MDTMKEGILCIIFLEEDFSGLHYTKMQMNIAEHVICVREQENLQE